MVAATTALLLFLLVEGCRSERAKSAGLGQAMAMADSAPQPVPKVTPAAPKPIVAAQPKPVTPPAPAALAPLRLVTPLMLKGAETYYVVKSGDTLARIAREHRVPVKTIIAGNNLNDDRLVVGTKLKLPMA